MLTTKLIIYVNKHRIKHNKCVALGKSRCFLPRPVHSHGLTVSRIGTKCGQDFEPTQLVDQSSRSHQLGFIRMVILDKRPLLFNAVWFKFRVNEFKV